MNIFKCFLDWLFYSGMIKISYIPDIGSESEFNDGFYVGPDGLVYETFEGVWSNA